MGLINRGFFTLHSGGDSDIKIDCDSLSDADINAVAGLVRARLRYSGAVGVPRGGLRLADALSALSVRDTELPILLVDDVYTTGASMDEWLERLHVVYPERSVRGFVIFARRDTPSWITSMFNLSETFISLPEDPFANN